MKSIKFTNCKSSLANYKQLSTKKILYFAPLLTKFIVVAVYVYPSSSHAVNIIMYTVFAI